MNEKLNIGTKHHVLEFNIHQKFLEQTDFFIFSVNAYDRIFFRRIEL